MIIFQHTPKKKNRIYKRSASFLVGQAAIKYFYLEMRRFDHASLTNLLRVEIILNLLLIIINSKSLTQVGMNGEGIMQSSLVVHIRCERDCRRVVWNHN